MGNVETRTGTSNPVTLGDATIHEVVAPVEGTIHDDRGAVIGSRLAARLGVPMRVLHVAADGEEPLPATTAALAVRPEVVTVAADGDVAETIRGETSGDGALLVLASEQARQWESVPSVGATLVSTAERPLVLCGPRTRLNTLSGAVVLGLDGSPTAEAALATAVDLASCLGVTLWLVKVVDAAATAQVERLRAEGQRVSESGYLRETAERLAGAGTDVAWEVIHGEDPAVELARFAAAREASFLVAATHGASGLARRVFGSVSLGLVEQATVPVLIRRSTQRELELTAG